MTHGLILWQVTVITIDYGSMLLALFVYLTEENQSWKSFYLNHYHELYVELQCLQKLRLKLTVKHLKFKIITNAQLSHISSICNVRVGLLLIVRLCCDILWQLGCASSIYSDFIALILVHITVGTIPDCLVHSSSHLLSAWRCSVFWTGSDWRYSWRQKAE